MGKIETIEVKRCFVISQLIRKQRISGQFLKFLNVLLKRKFLRNISKEDFEIRLKIAKDSVLAMSEIKLDKIIKKEYKKRLIAYNNSDWYLGEVSPNEVGVWKKAGELPLEWTDCSLEETAEKIEYAILINSKKFNKCRAKYTIENMLQTNVKQLQDEKYLLPIVFKGGTGTKGRKRLKRKMKYDIDDGCMRSIALTISGAQKIKAYIGFPKNK